MAEHIIEAENVVKRFGGLTAVDGISFSVRRGEFFGLLGPNGAGKTSTIRMLYGFSPVTGGVIRVFGKDIRTEWREIKSRMGVCHQENTLDPDLTVIQNLIVFAAYFYIPKSEALDRARDLLEFFALGAKRDARVMDLSGGMVRRLMLARALINRPELLILDEPTTGLDPQSRHQLWDKLEALRARGLTVLITTHYMEEAARLCDRLVIVDHGRVLVNGVPGDLIAQHAGTHVIEIGDPDPEALEYAGIEGIEHDDLGNRLILYLSDDPAVSRHVRDYFCAGKCIFRNSTLEDVFLRLTGRELRE